MRRFIMSQRAKRGLQIWPNNKFEWWEYGWVDKSEEIDARADY